jgi:hypothetical protein
MCWLGIDLKNKLLLLLLIFMRRIIEGCIVVGKSMAFDCLNFQSNVTEIVPAQKVGIFYLSTFIVTLVL